MTGSLHPLQDATPDEERRSDGPTGTRSSRSHTIRHAPVIVFAVYAIVAAAVILFVIGRHRWFFGDEWSFLAERDGGDIGDLFRSHGEHWVTIPVILYRALWNLFGLRTYLPYQAVVVAAHVITAFLLRVVMRRAGVSSWTATVIAAMFLLFGPGRENILWAFQISFVGAIMFGLVQLILSDHDGSIDRRDVCGLGAGSAALMCSGVALPMIAVVGLATFVRRGWRAAAFHVVPLAALYALWYLATDPGGIDNPYGRSVRLHEVVTFVWSGIRGTFVALGAYAPIAVVLALVLVVGVPLAWLDGRPRRRLAAPAALVVGALAFLVGTSVTRWFVTASADSQSRYLYILGALLLPALAVGADALIRRWRVLAPLLFGVLLVAGVKNATVFDDPLFTARYFQGQKELMLSMAHSRVAARVPDYVRPNPWFSIGWLRAAADDGDVPKPGKVSSFTARHVPFLLSIAQLDGPTPDDDCATYPKGAIVQPARGDRFGFDFASKPGVDVNFFRRNTVVVTLLGPGGTPVDSLAFSDQWGRTLEVETNGMTLRLAAADAGQPLVLCRRPA